MNALPMACAATDAPQMREDFRAEGNFEALERVEIDCVDAVKRLMRGGSPRLKHALVQVTLPHATEFHAT
jgi:hypothetical protein